MEESRKFRGLFFTVWALLVVSAVLALYHQDKFFAINRSAIARIARMSGPVSVRSEGAVRWGQAAVEQSLYDGDRVATGRSARSVVGFGEGRSIVLGDETQVQVTSIQQSDQSYAYLITLMRGSVVAEVDDGCAGCPPLIIRAGDETFNVAVGEKVGLFKQPGKTVRKFEPKGPWPGVRRPARKTLTASLDLGEKKEEPPPPPKKILPPKAKAKGFESSVRIPSAGLSYWTVLPLHSLTSTAIEIPLTPPGEKPKAGDWRPAVEVFATGNEKRRDVIVASSANEYAIRLSVPKIRQLSTISSGSGPTVYSFSVRGGARTGVGKNTEESFADPRLDFKINTFGEYSGGSMQVSFDKLDPVNDNSPWMPQKGVISPAGAAYTIQVLGGQDYYKLIPFIRGASAVGLARRGSLAVHGTFMVKGQAVVAELGGSAMDAGTARRLLDVLGGDFVFRGNRSALHDTRGNSQAGLVNWIGALLDKGKVLYILKRNKLYPVSRDFIKTNNEVAAFIDSQAKAIFLEQVEVIAYR